MQRENVKIYLTKTLMLIIGYEDGKIIKDACRLMTTGQGAAVACLFMDHAKIDKIGLDIPLKNLDFISSAPAQNELAENYIKIISGTYKQPEPVGKPKIQLVHANQLKKH